MHGVPNCIPVSSFRELRIACTVAQMEREGGISPRISPLAQVYFSYFFPIVLDILNFD